MCTREVSNQVGEQTGEEGGSPYLSVCIMIILVWKAQRGMSVNLSSRHCPLTTLISGHVHRWCIRIS